MIPLFARILYRAAIPMLRLIFADLARLRRSAWFWLVGALILGYTLWEVSQLCYLRANALTMWGLEAADFATPRVGDCSLPLLIGMSILCPLFINTDYHDGTIRNKLAVGRTRVQVYLSNLLTMLAAALFYTVIYEVVTMLAIALFIPNNLWDAPAILCKLVGLVPFILCVTALFTLIGHLIHVRVVPIVSIFLAIGLLWLPQYQFERLCAPEQIRLLDGVEMFVELDEHGEPQPVYWKDGEVIAEEELEIVPNPRYVPKPLRPVYTFLLNFLPGGQAFQLSDSIDVQDSSGTLLAIYGLLLSVLATGPGLLLFQRKDLK